MKFKIVAIFILALLAIVVANGATPRHVYAAANYTWEYNRTNVYNSAPINYQFSSLDAGQEYRWCLWIVDPYSGGLQQQLGCREFTGGTSTTAEFGGASLDSFGAGNDILYPDNYQGPLVVMDNLGNVLGRHFVAIDPTYYPNTSRSDWFTSAGNTALNDKQLVSNFNQSGYCESPVYIPVNSDGWQHSFKACSVSTTTGSYAIMHYQIDPTYVGPSMDRIIFYQIPGVTPIMTVYIDDILAFQHTSGFTGWTVADNAYSFLILNTGGDILPFINNQKGVSAFTTGDNPFLSNLSPGVYNYSRWDAVGWVSDGESVWMITDDKDGWEWRVDPVGNVSTGATQNVVMRATTPEVWDSYHGYQAVVDSLQGTIDTAVYAFSTAKTYSYAVSGSAFSPVVVEWRIRASSINAGLATPTEMEFDTPGIYSVVAFPTIEQSLAQVLTNFGMDNEAGRGAFLLIVEFVGLLVVASFSMFRANIFPYLIVWTGIGGTFIVGGFSTILITTVFSIMTIGMWMFAIMLARDENEA